MTDESGPLWIFYDSQGVQKVIFSGIDYIVQREQLILPLTTSDPVEVARRLRENGSENLADQIEKESKDFKCPDCGSKESPHIGLVRPPYNRIVYCCRRCNRKKFDG